MYIVILPVYVGILVIMYTVSGVMMYCTYPTVSDAVLSEDPATS